MSLNESELFYRASEDSNNSNPPSEDEENEEPESMCDHWTQELTAAEWFILVYLCVAIVAYVLAVVFWVV